MIRIIVVGTFNAKADTYIQRIKHCEFVQVKSVKGSDAVHVIQKEWERIQPHLIGSVFLLDALGTSMDSIAFSRFIQKHDQLCFVIGGAFGLPKNTKYPTISLSAMTFPHEMIHVMLAEQLYRAQCIAQHHPYHK
ncbi:MAG: 23S rRNA (pseudouridine(1915)-N(3))-methyltransferase RlmH [Candidatus Woesearchaeota archaeon]